MPYNHLVLLNFIKFFFSMFFFFNFFSAAMVMTAVAYACILKSAFFQPVSTLSHQSDATDLCKVHYHILLNKTQNLVLLFSPSLNSEVNF